MKLEVKPLQLRLSSPLVTARGSFATRNGCEVSFAHDGLVGRGESMPFEPFGTESLVESTHALRSFELSRAPHSVEDAHVLTESLSRFPSARCAAEAALLEWLAQRQKKPVAALFDGWTSRLAVSALVSGANMNEMTEQAKRFVDEGFQTLKVKVGVASLDVDAQRLASIRRAVGPHTKIRVDANGAWSEARARSALNGLESLQLEMCEQPLGVHDIEGLRRLCHDVETPIAADEVLTTPGAIDRILTKDPRCAADVLVLKPMALGGMVRTVQLAKRAQQLAIPVVVTTLIDGPIGRAIAVHTAAAVGATSWAHGLATGALLENAGVDALTPRAGSISLSSEAGWGVAPWSA